MSKGRWLILGVLGFLVAIEFQNCGSNASFQAATGQQSLLSTTSINPAGQPDSVPVQKVEQTSYEPLLADRYVLNSLFMDIFGPSARNVDSTRLYLDAINQGGPCSIYEDHNIYDNSKGKYVEADPMAKCSLSSTSWLSAPVNPKPTVTREALLTHTCSDLTSNDTTLRYALSRISSKAVPDPTLENVDKVFHLFYRAHPEASQGVLDSLLVMLPQTGATINDWRNVFFTVCISSYWQVL